VRIAITWDYELYFGAQTGTVESCMLEPTAALLDIARRTHSRFTFFPDAGYLIKAQSHQPEAYDRIAGQVKQWSAAGHETGLHIHPHWEDSQWQNGTWNMNLSRYKLSDFSASDAADIIQRYVDAVNALSTAPVSSFRAGGWCVQPVLHMAQALFNAGIRIDSSVFPGGVNQNERYSYDFSDCPKGDHWFFNDSECSSDSHGRFAEIPIASMTYGPLFFWRLFGWGRMRPSVHKPLGKGTPAAGGGSKWKFLLGTNILPVSADGYFVTRLNAAVKQAERKGWKRLVIIGHPKACTRFSLAALEAFIHKNRQQHQFVPLNDLVP
jgi:hypothetical protein